MKARIHSVESCGTVDGPGIRFVIFLQGCSLRCHYCHNPDTWNVRGGHVVDAGELIKEMEGYLPYMKASSGGVTLSGGEPLLQPDFVLDFFRRCKQLGVHTALDTNGFAQPKNIADILQVTDLVLLDIKHIDEAKHRELTAQTNRHTLAFARQLDELGVPVWIRHVLVPDYTTDEADLARLGEFIGSLSNVQKVEVLPYHKMGEYKWKELGLENVLVDTMPPSEEQVARAYELLTAHLTETSTAS
ncbi:pyruvate formate-lyase-activating protein [Numidum massiliense]|uniref:pyruvate formate-lyase-activating protein n=1 Tax=Numidum massiliense TaxID=1522315 RepID=UPI0006D57EEE|nr:pyruvate formate-lyase-activating protein [Numidum massiliense]